VFRGCALAGLAAFGLWRANLLASTLFVLAPFPGWALEGTLGAGEWTGHSACIFALGLLLGWAWHAARSLWTCVAVHAANDLGAQF
jgi:membrane protease YdiL (CAAX protease family)